MRDDEPSRKAELYFNQEGSPRPQHYIVYRVLEKSIQNAKGIRYVVACLLKVLK